MTHPEIPALFDHGPVQLWTARPNGELDYVNAAVLTYFGRSREQMLDWGWAELVHPDDLEEVGERWGESLETGCVYRVHFRLRRHDGEYQQHLATAIAHRDEAGAIVAWSGANTPL
ncbi:MAG: PAS domain-containing protein [Sandaracinaceae bacterium]